ncbi:hypothetical protein F0267_17345 [Vibrio coralliilyticus]|uniref:Uncharacterized protein n=1 Tax=Vibrio coralliilyticus TaxID=190893 RepID=A0AAN0SBH7_9VIBR|nr:hypothetical protein [Vibrio coralliilyticus]AIW18703.1 hypothetical protein IX92_06430 [Vibrio coralliilyticus]NOH39986.1 hypothetical protein [Vibrio coralliilyticus]
MATTASSVNVAFGVSDEEYRNGMKRIETETKRALGATGKEFNKFQRAANNSTRVVNKNFNTFAGQFGYQAQDVVVQLQAGQNAFVAFGQQGSQLLSVINPLYGLFAVLGTTAAQLAYSFHNTDKEATDFTDTLKEQLEATENLTKAQRVYLSNQYNDDLAQQALNRQSIIAAIREEERNLKTLQTQLAIVSDGQFTNAAAVRTQSAAVQDSQKRIDELTAALDLNEQQTKTLKEALFGLNPEYTKQKKAAEDAKTAYESLTGSLNQQIMAIGLSEKEQAKQTAQAQLGAGATDEQRAAINQLIDTLYAKKTAHEENTKAAKEEAEATKNAIDETATFADDIFQQARASQEALGAINESFVAQQNALYGQAGQILSQFGEESKAVAIAASALQIYSALAQNDLNLQTELAGIRSTVYADPTIPSVAAKEALAASLSGEAIALSKTRQALIVASGVAGAFHGGIDSLPNELNNSSFLLKAGERVVQPEANRELTDFLERQKNGQGMAEQIVINAPVNLPNGAIVNEQVFQQQLVKQRNTVAAAVKKVERERPNAKRR